MATTLNELIAKYMADASDTEKAMMASKLEQELPGLLDKVVREVGPAAQQIQLRSEYDEEYKALPQGDLNGILRLKGKYRKLGLRI